ncbi:MAG: hypothetical protein QG673_2064 [Pseudomonadota bacterium]|nr:hypothetical protein [Pseudomonadota bacterium]
MSTPSSLTRSSGFTSSPFSNDRSSQLNRLLKNSHFIISDQFVDEQELTKYCKCIFELAGSYEGGFSHLLLSLHNMKNNEFKDNYCLKVTIIALGIIGVIVNPVGIMTSDHVADVLLSECDSVSRERILSIIRNYKFEGSQLNMFQKIEAKIITTRYGNKIGDKRKLNSISSRYSNQDIDLKRSCLENPNMVTNEKIIREFNYGSKRVWDVLKVTANLFSKCNTLQDVGRLIDNLEKNKIYLDAKTYAAAIHNYTRLRHYQQALNLFNEVFSNKLRFKFVKNKDMIYFEVFLTCKKSENWHFILDLLKYSVTHDIIEEMQDDKFKIVYDIGILACAKTNDWDFALDLFNWMKRRIKPDPIACSMVLSLCALAGELWFALELFEEINNQRININYKDYNDLITCCAKVGQWEDADNVIQQAVKNGVFKNGLGYSYKENKLNLHCRSIVYYADDSSMGVTVDMALVLLQYHLRYGNIKHNTEIVTGYRGGTALREAVKNFFAQPDSLFNVSISPYNKGVLIVTHNDPK